MTKGSRVEYIAYFFHASPENTLAYHRIIGPMRQLGIDVIYGFKDGEIEAGSIEKGDVVVLQRDFPRHYHAYKEIISLARKGSKPVILDIDDLLFELPDAHPDRRDLIYSEAMLPSLQALMEVDMVTVATKPLQEYIQRLNENVHVLPNFLNDELWSLRRPSVNNDQSQPLTIGYMGGDSHEQDLLMVAPVLMDLVVQYQSEVRFTFWGIEPPVDLQEIVQVNHIPLKIFEYPAFVDQFKGAHPDIFIAPLVDNLFNRCKSAIKFLEYSALGVPGVYSDLQPYSDVITDGRDGYLASSSQEWLEYLVELIENPQIRSEMASRAQETVMENWMLSRNAHLWLETYQQALADENQLKEDEPIIATLRSVAVQVKELNQMQDQNLQNLTDRTNQLRSDVEALTGELNAKKAKVGELTEIAAEREIHLEDLKQKVNDFEKQVNSLEAQVFDRDQQIKILKVEASERERRIEMLAEQAAESGQQIQAYIEQSAIRERQLEAMTLQAEKQDQQIEALDYQLREITGSTTWKVAYQLRKLLNALFPPGAWWTRLAFMLVRALLYPITRSRKYQINRDIRLLQGSIFYNAEWYLAKYPDVARAGVDPGHHYLFTGGFEGRDPGPNFSSSWYLDTYPDVREAGMNPLVHYLQFGQKEGRIIAPELLMVDETSAVMIGASPWEPNSAEDHWSDYSTLRAQIDAHNLEGIHSFTPDPIEMVSIGEDDFVRVAQELSFREIENPQVSIIIPVFNNIQYTLECLVALKENTDYSEIEIIIVDDGSSDNTAEILKHVHGIRLLRNEENLGFLRTCNRGAELALGRYLLFLNNDVQVLPGWLRALVETYERESDVGVVGPKVLYPNGRLQEAGARINKDGTSQLIGVGDDPNRPRFNYLRDVDYCSGVCLMVEAERFRALNGFDEDFAPAYSEDVDFCFRMRETGVRIIYNPNATITHHLSVTSDDIGESYKMTQVTRNQQKIAEKWQGHIDRLNDVRLLAFYLPQFHPISENDRWWGKGFTEWTNVVNAKPNYVGHYQPHLPADLGFYDLRIEDVMVQQAELAKRYGIFGFCYYYYWFAGKRLLELPLERMLETGKPDIPFCLSWANENWTRRWDGLEDETLIAQEHSAEDDRAVILDIIRYFKNNNYIRIDGKPLLLIYRANLFPNIRNTIEIWREICMQEGIGEIYLTFVESFEHATEMDNPVLSGFDASVEFPPHRTPAFIEPPGPLLNLEFDGAVHDYRQIVMKYVEKEIPAFTRFRSVMPSWDNTARQQNNAVIFAHGTPGAYQAWLETVIQQTLEQNFGDERLIFITAWNEWAEGNHLEPDQRFGHGYLEATRNALDRWLVS